MGGSAISWWRSSPSVEEIVSLSFCPEGMATTASLGANESVWLSTESFSCWASWPSVRSRSAFVWSVRSWRGLGSGGSSELLALSFSGVLKYMMMLLSSSSWTWKDGSDITLWRGSNVAPRGVGGFSDGGLLGLLPCLRLYCWTAFLTCGGWDSGPRVQHESASWAPSQ